MSDDPKCPRCGTKLPTVTVQKPILRDPPTEAAPDAYQASMGFAEVEETGECVRCTGSY